MTVGVDEIMQVQLIISSHGRSAWIVQMAQILQGINDQVGIDSLSGQAGKR